MKNILKLLWLSYFLIASLLSFADSPEHIVVRGKVTCQKKAVENVAVSDGTAVVLTNSNGEYEIQSLSDRKFVYYSLPSGYNSPQKNGIPVFYQKIDSRNSSQHIDFELAKEPLSQEKHVFVVWADPQVSEEGEFPLLQKVTTDVNETLKSYSVPKHAICVGDLVFDKPFLFRNYKEMISQLNIPFYQVIGNHDKDYSERSNELSENSFTEAFGPTHYSYNVGKIHYIVLDDVFYYGYSYLYMGYLDENQLQWLESDLKLIRPGQTVVISLHIPTKYGDSENPENHTKLLRNSLMNNKAFYKIIEQYNIHIMAGHSHTQWNTTISDNILEHTHSAASASWWQGEIGQDGTPQGYTVYEVNGDSLSWYFKGVGMSKDEQFKLYRSEDGKSIIANVYNYDQEWNVYVFENNNFVSKMERYWGEDPQAKIQYQPGKNKKYSWLSVGMTNHLFKATLKDQTSKVSVLVIDRFGNKYAKDL
ncbi:MAG: hypothetical protein ACD_77C00236G0003 [uncultured bacterium]|nr:MAG: hypothetical protein ACD_77C00236G0003 [uncultured bacterium]HBY00939.1 serine/threonine protein phosphatase [Rikenellaceae bacterium]